MINEKLKQDRYYPTIENEDSQRRYLRDKDIIIKFIQLKSYDLWGKTLSQLKDVYKILSSE